jgi:hypothetical protein
MLYIDTVMYIDTTTYKICATVGLLRSCTVARPRELSVEYGDVKYPCDPWHSKLKHSPFGSPISRWRTQTSLFEMSTCQSTTEYTIGGSKRASSYAAFVSESLAVALEVDLLRFVTSAPPKLKTRYGEFNRSGMRLVLSRQRLSAESFVSSSALHIRCSDDVIR